MITQYQLENLRNAGELGSQPTVGELLDKKDRRDFSNSLLTNIYGLAKREKPPGVAGAVSREQVNDFRSNDTELGRYNSVTTFCGFPSLSGSRHSSLF